MYCRIQFAKNIYMSSRTRWLNKNVLTHQYNNRVFSTDITKACRAGLLNAAKGNVDKNQKIVGYWWLGCSGMISVAVLLGGLTRLTESGLSMVTWKLLGEKRPTNQQEWENEFNKYKQFPEFRMLNSSMTLEEFKSIYYMEYFHRMWGRAIGMFFLLPAAYFWSRGHLNSGMKKRVFAAGALIGAQGLMGWYMVKSGLEERFNDVNDVPRVSQYRLASHLSLAFFLHMLCLSAGLTCLLPPLQQFNNVSRTAFQLRKLAHISKGMVFLTAISGAFVAGLDAGLIFNSFPKMGDHWVPNDILAVTPVLKNFTENPTTVQFNHRLLGISTVSLISILYAVGRRVSLPKRTIWAMNSLVVVALAQVTLGVSTLLYYVPINLAAAHQSGSLMLLSTVVWLTHELKFLKYIPK